MTIPQQPPDNELPDPKAPEPEPSDEPTPGETPEHPNQERGWRAPGATEQSEIPLRAPSETPDAESGL